eukprot:contig_31630_g7714
MGAAVRPREVTQNCNTSRLARSRQQPDPRGSLVLGCRLLDGRGCFALLGLGNVGRLRRLLVGSRLGLLSLRGGRVLRLRRLGRDRVLGLHRRRLGLLGLVRGGGLGVLHRRRRLVLLHRSRLGNGILGGHGAGDRVVLDDGSRFGHLGPHVNSGLLHSGAQLPELLARRGGGGAHCGDGGGGGVRQTVERCSAPGVRVARDACVVEENGEGKVQRSREPK